MIYFIILLIMTLAISHTDTYAMGAVSYAGKSNPYAEYPVKREPVDDDQPMVVRRPQPAILIAQQNQQVQLINLQNQLQQAQQDLNIAQQNNQMEASKIQEKINMLSQQITALQNQISGR